MRRVVITGVGSVSSSGKDTHALWKNVINGVHGFVPIKGFDTSDFDIKLAAEIQNWNPEDYGIIKKEARRMDRFSQYALAAAQEAVTDAGDFTRNLDPFRVGVLVGSSVGGFETIESGHSTFLEKGSNRVSVFTIPMMIANMAGGSIAIKYGFKGENYAPVSACSSSNHAIGEAFRKIRHGYLDACVAGGAESCLTQFSLSGFSNMGALSKGQDPQRLSIPFDKERNGFVMGDGAGALILEELESAKARGANIYAEVLGYGATDDAYHMTSPDETGLGPATAMTFALEEASLEPERVDYINAHGTSTPLNDRLETKAIKLAFGRAAEKLAVSSTKSVTGHLLGAAGAIEGIICAKAIKEGVIPPTIGLEKPDPECDLDYVTEGPRRQKLSVAMSNSFGFGGHNASVIFGRYD